MNNAFSKLPGTSEGSKLGAQNTDGGSMDFSNQTVVVTGGTGALGAAVVNALLKAGARCVIPYINEAEAKSLPRNDKLSLVRCDLSDEAQVAALYAGAGKLDASI